MQFGETTQDVRRNILVAAAIRRAVLRLADPDVGGAIQQPLEADAGLRARQRGTGAAVDAATERQVLACVLALGVKRVRILEAPRVAVGRAVDDHQRAPGAERCSPTVVGTRDSRKSPLTGLSMRRHSSMKLGSRLRSSRSLA